MDWRRGIGPIHRFAKFREHLVRFDLARGVPQAFAIPLHNGIQRISIVGIKTVHVLTSNIGRGAIKVGGIPRHYVGQSLSFSEIAW